MHKRTSGVMAVIVLIVGAAAEADDRDYSYVYNGVQTPLQLREGVVAVLRSQERAAEDRPLGAPPSTVTPHAIKGWSLVKTAMPVDRAAEDDSVDFASPVFVDLLGGDMFITPTILVQFDRAADREAIEESVRALGIAGEVEHQWAGMRNACRIRTTLRSGVEVLDAANALAARPAVLWAEPDMVFTGRGALVPNDPAYNQCWGLHNTGQFGGTPDQDMDCQEAFDITTGSASIRILIIDTGVEQTHPDINQIPGFDATGENGGGNPVNQWDNHGTPVAGCCSARINNNLGGVGGSPGCPSASARTFITINSAGNWNSNASWTVNSLAWGESIGVRVTNNSNHYGFTSNAIAQKYQDMRNAGVIHFASAGNDGLANGIVYPANLPTVMAVAALTPQGFTASFSNSGPQMFIAAPGVNVYSPDRTGSAGFDSGDYILFGGTSAASPCAAGVAALVLSYNPFQSAAQVENILAMSAVDRGPVGWDQSYGWGFINALAAIQASPPAGPPGMFSLIAPADGAMQVARRPALMWSASQNATSYSVMVDDSPAFDSPVFSGGVTGTVYEWAGAPLNAATNYWWKVEAINSIGGMASTPAVAMFSTISVPPEAFSLLTPADGAAGVATTPSFTWQAANHGETYTIRIDDNADFSSPVTVFNTSNLLYNQSTPLAGATTYYWSVTANNPNGSTPSSPAVRTFTTILSPPLPFSLLSPADGAVVPTRTPTLTWNPSGGAASYTVIVDDSQDLASPIVHVTGHGSTMYQVPSGLLVSGTRYYWRIQAVNGAGTINGSPPTSTFVVLLPQCQGDANRDGLVNFTDISSVLSHWGLSGPLGDSNYDSAVNFIDISTTLTNWGAVCPG